MSKYVDVYKIKNGLSGVTQKSVVELAKIYEVSESSIRNWIKKGESECAATPVEDIVEVKPEAVEGVSGLSVDVIEEIQKDFNDNKLNKTSLAKKYEISPYKVTRALEYTLASHANDVVSVSSGTVGWDTASIGTVVVYDKENMAVVSREALPSGGFALELVPAEADVYNKTQFTSGLNSDNAEDLLEYVTVAHDEQVEVVGISIDLINSYDAACRIIEAAEPMSFKTKTDEQYTTSPTTDIKVAKKQLDEDGLIETEEDLVVFYDINHNTVDGYTNSIMKEEAQTDEHIDNSVSAEAPKGLMITPNQITMVKNGRPLTISRGHLRFNDCIAAATEQRWDDLIEFIDLPAVVDKYSNGDFKIEGGVVTFEGFRVEHSGFCKRVVDMLLQGKMDEVESAGKFIIKLMENPSNDIVRRVFDFLKFAEIKFAEDGDLLVFKNVRSDYKDCHSGQVPNTPGTVVAMRRNRVNEDDNQTCSYGLHVCSLSYLPNYAKQHNSRTVICKLNPADIVSIPTDYKDAKIRCCRYEVLKDVSVEYRQNKIVYDAVGKFSM